MPAIDLHIAEVVANDVQADPEKEFGVKLRIDSALLGQDWPEIAYPFFPPNFFKIPAVGEMVIAIIPADYPENSIEGEEVAMNEFADSVFYMLRGFDARDGKPFPDLLKNYPNRSGFWLENGTMILFDETKGQETVLVRLTTGKEMLVINDKGFTVFSQTKIRLGSGLAAEALHKGTLMNANLGTFLTAWLGLLTTLGGTSLDPATLTYANAMVAAGVGPLPVLLTQLISWLSTKTFIDV